ncbi:NAD(P)/FAD-dependent oxidoreductase [Flaviflagellibacter deserti]|jgi:thioredoxin reductase (NADPH)|uniref:Thioredoxin reductase n=1 Tax=Flaviflagellibacter deserti TaxID=2267266 RepID=A0ABV9Z2T0_9HYPH
MDALIIGGGPAGASCAVWLAKLGFDVAVVDARPNVGGLLNDSPFVNGWIATQPGVTGPDLAEQMGLSLAAIGVPLMLGCRVTNVEAGGRSFSTTFEMHTGKLRTETSRLVVLATGVRPRSGGLGSAPKLLFGPGRHVHDADFAGKTVAILGSGDNAFENYDFVRSRGADTVHIYARSPARAGRFFRERVPEAGVRIGPYEVDEDKATVDGSPYDLILVMYGWEPTPLPGLSPELDEQGYVKTHPETCETSISGVYAIGEMTRRAHPSVVTAMADGVVAAKAIQRVLEGG